MSKSDPCLARRQRAVPDTSEISSRADQKVRSRHLTGYPPDIAVLSLSDPESVIFSQTPVTSYNFIIITV